MIDGFAQVAWTAWIDPADYDVGRVILQRGVALTYLIAFANARNQFRPLLGERGLLPTPAYLAVTTFSARPSLFHWGYSDRRLAVVAWTGMAIATLGVVGGFDVAPLPISIAAWIALWVLYLSIVNVGQQFYGFGWESLLLESGLTVALLGNGDVAVPLVAIVLVRWLLFRVEFGAGMIKMRGDACWRDLTCLEYHHETQPMPNPLSRWFHLLPRWTHRVETASNHVAQLIAPWLLFLPQPLAGVGAVCMIATQAYLIVSGNYAWLNLVTLTLGFAAIPDSWFEVVGIGDAGHDTLGEFTWFTVLVMVAAAGVAVLSRRPLLNLFSGRQRMNASFNRYHLVNSYGAFGSVTKQRREVVIEGSPDGATWVPYEFKGKPTSPARRPAQFAPYHLRLDWLMWFAALSPRYAHRWFDRLLDQLLGADHAVLALLANDPFDGAKPALVRARLVDYRFATRAERRESGAYWVVGRSRPFRGPVGH